MAETIVSLPQRSKYDIMHLVVMRMKLVKMTLCLCLSLMTLCGCRATHDQVLVTCYPLQYLVEQIAQDRVSCVLLSENTLIQRAQIRDGGFAWGCDRCTDACPVNLMAQKSRVPAFYEHPEPVVDAGNAARLCGEKAYGWRGTTVLLRNLEIICGDARDDMDTDARPSPPAGRT